MRFRYYVQSQVWEIEIFDAFEELATLEGMGARQECCCGTHGFASCCVFTPHLD